jgi:hypothetical protein
MERLKRDKQIVAVIGAVVLIAVAGIYLAILNQSNEGGIRASSGGVTTGNTSSTSSNQTFDIQGTTSYSNSCWFITTSQPALYLLVNPPVTLRSAGLNVTVQGELVSRPTGTCQEGIPIEVLNYTVKS